MAQQTQWLCRGPWCACADSVTECACFVMSRVHAAALAIDGVQPTCWDCHAWLKLIDFDTGEVVAGAALAGGGAA